MNEIIIKTGHVLQPADLLLTMEAEPFGDGQRISWRVSNTGETEFHGVLRLICELPSWVSQPWWMIPGFFYGDNKLVCPDEADKPAAWPQFDANVTNPARMVSSHWDFAADRSASPLVYLHDNDRCLALCAFPHYDTSSGCSIDEYELQVGMGFGFDGKAGYVRLSIPGTEEPFTYANSSQSYPTIRRITIPPGGWVSGTAYTFDFAGARHDYQKIMECYYNELAPLYPSAKPILEPTELRELMRDAMFGQIAAILFVVNYVVAYN
ncbi:MAG: hypothetical protein GWP14_08970, partial [Actinobacteria bacterium]|nr:hypothetical protein [Actinomycetota bacterium]